MPADYSLNFLWINLNPQDRIREVAQNIFNEGLDSSENAQCIKNREELHKLEKMVHLSDKNNLEWKKIAKSFTYKISKWADINPQAQINVWYDSALVTQKAFQKTLEMMQSISLSRNVILKLKDIRRLPKISKLIKDSLHPGTNVYYRVDILKALIADYMISSSKESAKYFVFSDIDVEPMSPKKIFDGTSMDFLSLAGYVFMKLGLRGLENGFFIFNKEKEGFREIHYDTIIKATENHLKASRTNEYFGLNAESVYGKYFDFQLKMNEYQKKLYPRKFVKSPRSQFFGKSKFSIDDPRLETFCLGIDNIPRTTNGRNAHSSTGPIMALANWKVEALEPSIINTHLK